MRRRIRRFCTVLCNGILGCALGNGAQLCLVHFAELRIGFALADIVLCQHNNTGFPVYRIHVRRVAENINCAAPAVLLVLVAAFRHDDIDFAGFRGQRSAALSSRKPISRSRRGANDIRLNDIIDIAGQLGSRNKAVSTKGRNAVRLTLLSCGNLGINLCLRIGSQACDVLRTNDLNDFRRCDMSGFINGDRNRVRCIAILAGSRTGEYMAERDNLGCAVRVDMNPL